MRRGWIVVVGLLVVVVLAFLIVVPVVLQRNLSAEAVAERASLLAGRPVTVERVRLTFRPDLRIRAEGVVVGDSGGTAEAIEASLRVLPLLRRRVEPSELHLLRARLPVERSPEGALRFRLLHPPGGRAGAGSFPALPAIDANDGEIFLVESDGTPARAPVLRILRLEQGPLREVGRTPVRLEVALDPAEGGRYAFGRLRVGGFLERTGEGTALREGEAEGDDVMIRGLLFAKGEARFEYRAGRIEADRLDLSGYQGTVSFRGVLAPGRPNRMEGVLGGSGLDLSTMAGDATGRKADRIQGSLDLDGRIDVALRRTQTGSGRIETTLVDGAVPSASLFRALLGAIGHLSGKVFSLGADASPAASTLRRATASWELRSDDRLHTEDLWMITDDYEFRATGSIGLDETIALSGSVELTNGGAQRMIASAALPFGKAGQVIPEIPVTVGGRLGDVDFSARATGIPGAAASSLAGLVRGGGGLVEDAGRAGGELLEGAGKAGKGALDRVLGR